MKKLIPAKRHKRKKNHLVLITKNEMGFQPVNLPNFLADDYIREFVLTEVPETQELKNWIEMYRKCIFITVQYSTQYTGVKSVAHPENLGYVEVSHIATARQITHLRSGLLQQITHLRRRILRQIKIASVC